MTFEERQRAEEEIAAYLHQHIQPKNRERYRLLRPVERLVLLYGMTALLFNDAMNNGDLAEAAMHSQQLRTIHGLIGEQLQLDACPA